MLSIVAGVSMEVFYKYVATTMFPDFNFPEAGKLSAYTAVYFFYRYFTQQYYIQHTTLRKPFVEDLVSYNDYLKGGIENHNTGILGALSVVWVCV